jgi:AcrR family transcriptional regulator
MTRQLTTKGAKRRSELMEFTAHRFAVDGYHSTSITSIVEGMGVGKGVFYWYFDSKEAIFVEILGDGFHSMRQAQREAIAGEPDPARRIELGIRSSLRWLSEHRHLFVLMEFARTEERFAPIVRQADEQSVADALPHVSAGITAGLLRGEDPVVLTLAILGVTGHLARKLVLEEGEDPDRVAGAVIAFCREGYVATRTSTRERKIA